MSPARGQKPTSPALSHTALLGATALREALQGVDLTGRRVAFVNGTTVGGMDLIEHTDDPQALRHYTCSDSTADIARLAGLRPDVCHTISTACSAALNAVIVGCEMLAADEADIVIAGGAEGLTQFHAAGFAALHIVDPDICRPFDATRAGLNLGEGAAYLVLQRHSSLLTPHSSLAYVTGYANACDAYHQTASSPDGDGATLAMTQALQRAQLQPHDIGYVSAHATGTPDNDRSESQALRRVFGEHMPPIAATKSLTGHTTSASGAIELVITLLALRHQTTFAGLPCRQPDPDCVVPCTQHPADIRHAMCNAFGFGGNDSTVIISQAGDVAFQPHAGGVGFCPHAGGVAFQPHAGRLGFCPSAPEAKDISCANGACGQKPTPPACGQKPTPPACGQSEATVRLSDTPPALSPRELRRMGTLLREATLAALRALADAGITTPDAIVAATQRGMLESSEKIRDTLRQQGPQAVSPTLFMLSTHNTLASAIAIRTRCHGYNITYTDYASARADARRLLRTGQARHVLLLLADEATPAYQALCQQAHLPVPASLFVEAHICTL